MKIIEFIWVPYHLFVVLAAYILAIGVIHVWIQKKHKEFRPALLISAASVAFVLFVSANAVARISLEFAPPMSSTQEALEHLKKTAGSDPDINACIINRIERNGDYLNAWNIRESLKICKPVYDQIRVLRGVREHLRAQTAKEFSPPMSSTQEALEYLNKATGGNLDIKACIIDRIEQNGDYLNAWNIHESLKMCQSAYDQVRVLRDVREHLSAKSLGNN